MMPRLDDWFWPCIIGLALAVLIGIMASLCMPRGRMCGVDNCYTPVSTGPIVVTPRSV